MNSYEKSKKIFDSMSKRERVILYCIGSSDMPLYSKVRIQKLMFLCVKALPEILSSEFIFSTHKKGPYSPEMDETILTFLDDGLISPHYGLTPVGKEVYNNISPHRTLKEVIEDNENFIRGLNEDELLTYIYVTYPETRVDSEEWSRLEKKLDATIISLFSKGKISFSRATELTGMDAISFAEYLKKSNIRWRAVD